MKEQNGSENKKGMSKERKFYLFTAIGCAVTLVAIILVAVLIPTQSNVEDPTVNRPSSSVNQSVEEKPNDSGDKDSGASNEPVVNTPEGMMMPIEQVSVSNDYGFYYNQTLNNYYEHQGMDFAATVGFWVSFVTFLTWSLFAIF